MPPRDPRRRRKQRLLAYGSLLGLVLGLLALQLYLGRPEPLLEDQRWADIDFAALPEVELLRAYARIDTSATTGSELAGALFLKETLESAGVPVHLERLGERQANLWAIVEGEDPRALVLHHHIDVYPVEDPDAWDFPPFGAEIVGPSLYGRGVFDMKSVAAAQLEAVLELARSGRRPRRSVILLATGSEEIDSELGTRWILARHPELTERFWVVLTEGGIVEPVTRTEIKYWGVEFAQKRFATYVACDADRERLETLRQEINDYDDARFEAELVDEMAAFLPHYARSRGRSDYQEVLGEARGLLHDPFAFAEIPLYLQAMFRNEVVAFPVQEAPGGGFRLQLQFHLLPGVELEEVRATLLPDWLVHGVTLQRSDVLGGGGGSPLDHPAYVALTETVREAYPDTEVGPYFLPWSATDSRFFRAAGIPSYGFSPFLIFNTDTFRVDQRNERIGLPGYVDGVRLYRQVVRRLVD